MNPKEEEVVVAASAVALRQCVKKCNRDGKRGGEMSKKEGGRKGRGCAPQARHSLCHDAAAGGASAERAESVESTEREESVETGKAGPAQSALRRGLKDNEREIGGRIGEKRRKRGRRRCAPQARRSPSQSAAVSSERKRVPNAGRAQRALRRWVQSDSEEKRGVRMVREEGEGGGVARHKRVDRLAKAQHRAGRAQREQQAQRAKRAMRA